MHYKKTLHFIAPFDPTVIDVHIAKYSCQIRNGTFAISFNPELWFTEKMSLVSSRVMTRCVFDQLIQMQDLAEVKHNFSRLWFSVVIGNCARALS